MPRFVCSLAAAAALALAGSSVRAQTITVLPKLPGGTFTFVDAISSDGTVVCGDGGIASGNARAWRWTAATGMTNLGTLSGGGAGTDSYGYGMSGDGLVVVGASGAAYDVAHRWTAATGMQPLGNLLAGQPSFAFDASFDGSVITGDGYSAVGQRAFRWTVTGGMQPLTQLLPGTGHSVGLSVSASGSTIVGYCYNNAPSLVYPAACLWNAAGAISSLGILPGSQESVPSDVNADGSVVVGYCASTSGGSTRAFRWTAAGGIQDLGFPAGASDAIASGVTGDGGTVVGYSAGTGAWIWTGSGLPRNLATELQSRAINVTGWQFQSVVISSDGSALAGSGMLNGVQSAWYVRIGSGCTAAPVIGAQPMGQSVRGGTTVSLNVSATGGTLSFQWYKGANLIPGAVGATLTFAPAAVSDSGTYSCIVQNACGSSTSNSAALLVTPSGGGCGPSITAQPTDTTVALGQSAHFALVATSDTSLDYQWRKDTIEIPGANDNTYTVEPVTTDDAGTYDCAVTDACGTTYSRSALLSLPGGCTAPTVSAQSGDQAACRGGSVMLSVTSQGSGPISYQWRVNSSPLVEGSAATGAVVNGSASPTLQITQITVGEAGVYDCVVTGSCGFASTVPATITVCAGDFNCSGAVSTQDIFDFLAAWFSGGSNANFNGVDGLGVQDIFDFLGAWFAGC